MEMGKGRKIGEKRIREKEKRRKKKGGKKGGEGEKTTEGSEFAKTTTKSVLPILSWAKRSCF